MACSRSDWGTLSPMPPGIYRFDVNPGDGCSREQGQHCCCPHLRCLTPETALGSRPRVALSSAQVITSLQHTVQHKQHKKAK